MKSAASVAGHPLHPMLIPLPMGLWIFSLLCDIVTLATGSASWNRCAFYAMAIGTLGALLAALPGFWDLYTMGRSKAKTVGIWHMSINLAIVVVSAVDVYWRRHTSLETGQLVLSALAVLLLVISGWLGGEMVYVHGVAVVPVDRKEER